METYRNLTELEKVLRESKVTLELEFVARVMKVLELAQEHMEGETEQKELVGTYANTLYHEITEFFEPEEFTMLEDDQQLNIID